MKPYLNFRIQDKTYIFCLLFIFTSFHVYCQTPLSRNYTIGAGQNFTTIKAAVSSFTINDKPLTVIISVSDAKFKY